MSATPNPNIEGADAAKISDQVGQQTEPARAPDLNAKPRGQPTKVSENANAEGRRGLERENESADTLARAGYDIEQNPGKMPNGTKPDYRIDGKIFDNYAPKSGSPRSIWSHVKEKIDEEQTERVVLNLADSPVDLGAMRAQLHEWPINGLKEVISIDRQGNILHLFP